MTDNVRILRAVPRDKTPDIEIIEKLEHLLTTAKEGGIDAIGIVYVDSLQNVFTKAINNSDKKHHLVAGASYLQFDILKSSE